MEESWSTWRKNSSNREPVGRVDDCKTAIRGSFSNRTSFGALTSLRPPTKNELQFIAFRHGVNIAEAKKLVADGKVKRWQIH